MEIQTVVMIKQHIFFTALELLFVKKLLKRKIRRNCSDSKLSPLSVIKIKRLFIQFVKAVEVFLHDFEMKEPELQKC